MWACHTPSDRRLLAALAVRAIEAGPRQREAIFAELTSARPDLREALMRLVRESADGGSSGGSPSLAAAGDPLEDLAEAFEFAAIELIEDPFDQSGTTIDRYRLLRRIGVGASGAVYAAQPAGSSTFSVALKLLHPGVASPRSILRFTREQQVLASLDHPGVARLVDSGTGPHGRPYLVMDLIDGPNLLTHCRSHAPSPRERVELIARVCDALQHVHERGVVHRDVKPGNILVQVAGGAPAPVVIDFGVARLVDPDPDHALTTLGRQLGTRRYMSPEQRSGGAIDARTDVYSLGVTIADVLAGPTPKGQTGRATSTPTLRPEAVARMLPRALRAIVDRCIRQRRGDRYQGVAEIAADLRHFAAGEALAPSAPSKRR